MTDLVERYVYEVGRYLPESERDEVQNELRSLIHDQLDDRFKGDPTEDDVVALLAEFGEPRQMAASYKGDQYLIGPDLYPTMMWVLQRGWVWVPGIVVLVRVLVAFLTGGPGTLIGLLLETAFTVVQAVFIFSGIVVLIFAIMQHTGVDLEEEKGPFDPRELPEVNDPGSFDRGEVAFSIAFNIFAVLIFSYFLRVGGLTLRFNLTDPVDVLPVPTSWLIVDIIAFAALVLVNVLVLKRSQWNVPLLLADGVLDLITIVAGYFVILQPLFGLLYERVPALTSVPFAENFPLILAVIIGFLTLVEHVVQLGRLLFGRRNSQPFISVQPGS